MPGKCLYIRDNDGLRFCPACATNAPALSDTRAGYRALEGTKHQFFVLNQIKSYPEQSKLFFKRSHRIGQVRHQVWLAIILILLGTALVIGARRRYRRI